MDIYSPKGKLIGAGKVLTVSVILTVNLTMDILLLSGTSVKELPEDGYYELMVVQVLSIQLDKAEAEAVEDLPERQPHEVYELRKPIEVAFRSEISMQ